MSALLVGTIDTSHKPVELILWEMVTNVSYCSDDRRITWRPSFIAFRLLT
jgi:hypothetical protein